MMFLQNKYISSHASSGCFKTFSKSFFMLKLVFVPLRTISLNFKAQKRQIEPNLPLLKKENKDIISSLALSP